MEKLREVTDALLLLAAEERVKQEDAANGDGAKVCGLSNVNENGRLHCLFRRFPEVFFVEFYMDLLRSQYKTRQRRDLLRSQYKTLFLHSSSCAEECGSPTQSGSYRLREICGSESVAWKQNPSKSIDLLRSQYKTLFLCTTPPENKHYAENVSSVNF
jgi:hypothetical protein